MSVCSVCGKYNSYVGLLVKGEEACWACYVCNNPLETESMSSKRIWKYVLPINDKVAILMPRGARILSVQMQGEILCLWALCDPAEPLQNDRYFRVAGTNHPIDDNDDLFYLDSVQMRASEVRLVWHVFEIIPDVTA